MSQSKYFTINGYFKDDPDSPFDCYLVKEFDDMDEGAGDDDVFFYGMSEEVIKDAIKLGTETVHDFVITSYEEC